MPFVFHHSTRPSTDSENSGFIESHIWKLVGVSILLRLLAAATFPLFYKEAYFWEWSHFLSFGYLDHPPIVAWTIKAFTLWLPDHWLLAIRAGALLFGAASLILIYRVAWKLFGNLTVATRALGLALAIPLLHAVGALMTPDAPLVFFHLLSLCLFISALQSGRTRDWLMTGSAMGFALQSKLMALPSLVAFGLFLASNTDHRRWLKQKEPYLALSVAIAIFLPYILWNQEHDWASFRMQLWDRHAEKLGFGIGKTAEFCFEQLVDTFFLSVPILVCLAVPARTFPIGWQTGYQLLRYQSLTTLGCFLLAGMFTQTHPHWTVLAYPPAAIALAAWWSHQGTHPIAQSLKWLAPLALATVLLVIGLVPLARPILMNIPTEGFGERWEKKISTARMRLFGWPELVGQIEHQLQQVSNGADMKDGALFTYSYKQSSMLAFHRRQGLTINLEAYLRSPKNVGDAAWYYLPPTILKGRSGIFITDGSGPGLPELRQLFRSVEPLPTIEKHAGSQLIGRYLIYRVQYFQPASNSSD